MFLKSMNFVYSKADTRLLGFSTNSTLEIEKIENFQKIEVFVVNLSKMVLNKAKTSRVKIFEFIL